MITRDNKASISGTAQSARQRLGEVIRYYREDRDLAVRAVASRAKVAAGLVEDWEAGKAIPNSDEWKALCRGVNRALNAHQDLYARARKEAEDEARARAEQRSTMRPDTKINTALGDKLAKITDHTPPPARPQPQPTPAPALAVVPDPPNEQPPSKSLASADLGQPVRGLAVDGRKLPPMRPAGSDTTEARNRRRNFVRELLAAFPDKRTTGADSVVSLVRKTFGIGISPEAVDEIREELKREQLTREVTAEVLKRTGAQPIATDVAAPAPAPNPPPMPAAVGLPVGALSGATNEPHAGDLEAAVELVLAALPGLQTFTIHVDENGEASVDYQIRKVKVETVGGSIKVKR